MAQAIIDDRGRQYVVQDGESLLVDHMPGLEAGAEVVFDRVLRVDGTFGTPTVDGATVKAVVEEQFRTKKLHVIKFKRRKDYRRKQGHRQHYTRVQITSING